MPRAQFVAQELRRVLPEHLRGGTYLRRRSGLTSPNIALEPKHRRHRCSLYSVRRPRHSQLGSLPGQWGRAGSSTNPMDQSLPSYRPLFGPATRSSSFPRRSAALTKGRLCHSEPVFRSGAATFAGKRPLTEPSCFPGRRRPAGGCCPRRARDGAPRAGRREPRPGPPSP